MKQLHFLSLILLGAVVAFSSCSDSESTYHTLGITSASTSSDYALIYADQPTDVLKINSTDNWTASTTASWISFPPAGTNSISQGPTYKNSSDSTYSATINIQPNTTGNTRLGVVRVETNKHHVGLPVYQVGYLNITSITPTFSDPTNHNGASFTLTALREETSVSVSFDIYQPATITTSADWVTVETDHYSAGNNTAQFTLEPNTTGQSRTATLTITSSCGARTSITLTQQG